MRAVGDGCEAGHHFHQDGPDSEFQQQVLLEYDGSRYPFRETIHAVLREPHDVDLAKLHETRLGRDTLICFQKRQQKVKVEALGPRGNPWNREFHSGPTKYPHIYSAYKDVYHDFLRTFVLEDLRTSRIAFQTTPTFRCHLPDCGAPGRPHRDQDYHHPPWEINYWIPVTQTFGNNSLFVESRRNVGDFTALECSVGQLVRFYGNQVWHFCRPNDTGSTRVSIDCRVIREEDWCPEAFSFFKLGGYYSVMTKEGLLERSSDELKGLQDRYQSWPTSPPSATTAAPQASPNNRRSPAGTACQCDGAGKGGCFPRVNAWCTPCFDGIRRKASWAN